jgi:hypothetical protein
MNVCYSECLHQHISAATVAIHRVMLLLREYKGADVVRCLTVTQKQ